MGKGARNREKYTEERVAKKEQAIVLEKKNKRNKLITKIVATILAVVIAVSGTIYFTVFANGSYLRNNIVASSENFRINNAMMTYFVKSSYVSMQMQYGEYFTMFTGIDPAKSLKKQYIDEEKKTSWFQNIVDTTKTYVTEVLLLNEAAKLDGVTLTEAEIANIDEDIKDIDPYFTQNGVSLQDIKDVRILIDTAQKYESEVKAQIEISDNEINNYYDENENTYRTVGYKTYSINYADGQAETVVPYTQEVANEKTEELKNASSSEDFDTLVTTMVKEQNPEMSDEDVKSRVEGTLVANGAYNEDDEFLKWAFGDERVAGESYVIKDEETKVNKIYYLLNPAERNEDETVDFRHILFASEEYNSSVVLKEKAQEILDMYNKDASVENFSSLASENTDDVGSRTTGGLYTGVAQGQMVPEIDEWIFDSERKVGDVELIETDYGTHIVYFDGEGKEVWQETVIIDMKNADFDEKMTKLAEDHPIISDSEKLNDIPV